MIFEAGDGFACGSDVGGEVSFDGIGTGAQLAGRQDEMAVVDRCRDGRAVQSQGGELAVAKVEEEGLGDVAQVEGDNGGGVGAERVRDQNVREVVVEIGDAGGALLGEGVGDAVGDFGGVGGGGGSQDGHEDKLEHFGGSRG